MASDKLFFFLFQSNPDLILRWLEDLPVVILEAQMAADPGFLLRLYAETGRFLQQRAWSGDWRVVVSCPHRELNFGNPEPVREFLEHRVHWIELQPRDGQPAATPLARALSLLLQPESLVRSVSDALRQQALSDTRAAEVLPLIPAIVLSRFSDHPLSEICEMVGITLDDFTKSRAYQEIFGLGVARGEARGEAREGAKVTLRLLSRRCGSLSAATTARIKALPLDQLEALAEALLDFTGPADLDAWLTAHV